MSDIPRIKSEPTLTTLSPQSQANADELLRRKSTVSYPQKHYHPRMVLSLIVGAPNHAYIGITPNLKPLIELTIKDLQNELSDHSITENYFNDQELIDKALVKLEISEFKSFIPLQASLSNFETILNQKYTFNLIQSICHALIGSFLSGYNTSLLNLPSKIIQNNCNLNITLFSELQTFYCVGGLVGAIIAGYIADKYGRKFALIFANSLFLLSGIISLLYTQNIFGQINKPKDTFIYFILSRIISGIASGISTAIVPTYLGEISPAIIRGEIGTLNAFINAFGILFSIIIGCEYILGSILLWKYLFIVNMIPPIIQLILMKYLCESPQWLLINNKQKMARNIFKYLRESENVEFDMRSIKTKSCNQSLIDSNIDDKSLDYGALKTGDQTIQNIEYFKKDINEINKTVLIYIFSITILLQILQQFSGINSVWYYSTLMLENAGLTSPFKLWIGNILIASSNFFGVLIPVKLIEKLGRKLLIYLSCFGMIITSILLSIILFFSNEIKSIAGYLSVIMLILYVISFAMGLGPIVGLLTVELSPSQHRGSIVSVAFFINYLANLFVAQYANLVVKYIYYLPFAVICFFGIIFTYFLLPETKGKKEIDIQLELLHKVTK